MNPGLIGGIAGCVIGCIGGAIGTAASIRNTSSQRERSFVIKASIIGWVLSIVFVVLLLALPSPWRFMLWLPYSVLLPLGIVTWNRTQQRIRDEESSNNSPDADVKI